MSSTSTLPASPPTAAATPEPSIRIRKARTHNLRNVDVDLPLGQLIVITGVSGSGKSSLAFDTLFAEGQRRYLESVSVHTRSLLKELTRPDVDEVSGLPPTVSVDQRVTTAPARSTLAVTTEIYDYLRLLYARAGTAHCTSCGQPVESQTVDQIVDRTLFGPPQARSAKADLASDSSPAASEATAADNRVRRDRTKLMVLSPLVRGRKGAHQDVFERIARNGFVRVRVDGQQYDIAEVPKLTASRTHTIEAVIDRIILKEGIEPRLRESIQLAVRESDGTCIICEQTESGWQDKLFSTRFSCADCDLSFPAPEPRTFSFNSAWGACPECQGFGVRGIVDDSSDVTVFRQAACPSCQGSRLQPFASAVTFLGQGIADLTAFSVDQALQWLADQDLSKTASLSPEAVLVAQRTLPDIHQRLSCLQQVGLGYLTLDRPTRTLSGGEFQRARLAACLGTGLHGACFVLDEPTAGLHPRDTARLLQTLTAIRDTGATVVIVEHDLDVMRAADWLVDLGPGAGADGGHLLYSGPPQNGHQHDSPTARYLQQTDAATHPANSAAAIADTTASGKSAAKRSAEPKTQQQLFPADAAGESTDPGTLTIRDARLHNLQNLTVTLPLQQLVCVTGVSGSGKSSLIMDTLLPVAEATFNKTGDPQTALADSRCAAIQGLDQIQAVVSVDHSPLSRNRRSSIATYSGLWDHIRKILAKTRDARARGFTARRFSFNSGDGRCSECKGTGLKDIRMNFLPDATVPCPVCHGRRFNPTTLTVRFAGYNAADLLELRVDAALDVFSEFESLRRSLQTFHDVGLGYLTLGQPASTFSGGESQRVRLATELSSTRSAAATARLSNAGTAVPAGRLYLLDEPTTGLHPADVDRLLDVLRGLVQAGHSVLVIEHNLQLVRAADWLLDIGPDSSADGGQIVFNGPLSQALQSATGHTATALHLLP